MGSRFGCSAGALAGPPFRDLLPRGAQPAGELPADGHLDPDQVQACADQRGGLVDRDVLVGLAEGGTQPRSGRVAEHRHGLVPNGSLGIDPLDRGRGQPARLDLGDGAPVGLPEERGLERQVDRAGCHVPGQLLWLLVVLEEGHRKREGDPGSQRVRVLCQPPIDHAPGERRTGRIEPVDAEQPQDRAFLADGRGGPCPRAPGTGQGARGRDQPVGRTPGVSHRGRWGRMERRTGSADTPTVWRDRSAPSSAVTSCR